MIKQIPVRLEDSFHKKLKIIAVNENTSIQKIIQECLNRYVEEYESFNQKK